MTRIRIEHTEQANRFCEPQVTVHITIEYDHGVGEQTAKDLGHKALDEALAAIARNAGEDHR